MMGSRDGNEMEVKGMHHIDTSRNHSFKGLGTILKAYVQTSSYLTILL